MVAAESSRSAVQVSRARPLEGRVVLVTGASSGLGARFARVFHSEGAKVVITARRQDRLDALASELGDNVCAIPCDVTDDDDCSRLIAEAIAFGGRIDVLVNNAGIAAPGRAEEQDPDEFRRVIEVNLNAVFVLARLVAPHMIAQGSGSIINVSSMFGLVASWGDAGYAASKAAVVNLTRELAAQWARHGVRVNALAPGWFVSEMSQDLLGDEEVLQWVRRNTLLGRPAELEEMDGPVIFLASDASSYVTGQVLVVDGGWTAR